MAAVTELLRELADHMDHRLPAGLYAAVSVRAEDERSRLRRRHRVFVDPAAAERVDPRDLAHTAARVISEGAIAPAGIAGIASLGGLATVPPEAVAQLVAIVRLAQRLAVVYGLDPETERGRLAVMHALAVALEIDAPGDGPLDARLSDLPKLVSLRNGGTTALALARSALRASAWAVVRRTSRFLPMIGPGLSFVNTRARLETAGRRMHEEIRRRSGVDGRLADVTDAVEVANGPRTDSGRSGS